MIVFNELLTVMGIEFQNEFSPCIAPKYVLRYTIKALSARAATATVIQKKT